MGQKGTWVRPTSPLIIAVLFLKFRVFETLAPFQPFYEGEEGEVRGEGGEQTCG